MRTKEFKQSQALFKQEECFLKSFILFKPFKILVFSQINDPKWFLENKLLKKKTDQYQFDNKIIVDKL